MIKQVEGLQVRLKALQHFANELITGDAMAKCYREEAAEEVNAAITKRVADARPKADSGIHRYQKADTQ